MAKAESAPLGPLAPPAQPSSLFRRGLVLNGGSTAVNIVFLFAEMICAVRFLTAASYGTFVLMLAIVNFLVIAVDFGFKNALTQMIASSQGDRQISLVRTAAVFRLSLIGIVAVVVLVGQAVLTVGGLRFTVAEYAHYLPLMLLTYSLDELLYGVLRGFQIYRPLAVAQILRSVIRLCTTWFLLVVLHLGLPALIFSWLISFTLSIAYQGHALPQLRGGAARRSLLWELLRFGAPLQLSSYLWFVFSSIHIFLLATLASPASVAAYAVAARLPDACQRLSESFIAVYFPAITRLFTTGQRQQAERMLAASLRLLSFFVAVFALVTVLYSQQIITMVFSATYKSSGPVLALLMLAFHMLVLVSVMGYTLTAAGFPGRSLIENVVRTALIIVGNLVLIPVFGVVGSALAVMGASYAAHPVALALLRRSGIAPAIGPYAVQTLLLLLCSGFAFWLQPAAHSTKVAIGAFFILVNLALGTVTRTDLQMMLPPFVQQRIKAAQQSV